MSQPFMLRAGFVALSAFALVHCSGGAAAPSALEVSTAPTTPRSAPGARVLATFEGSFDVESRRLSVVYHSGSHDLQTDAVLPYGTGPNQVYFHTVNVRWEGSTCAPTTLCADVTTVTKLDSPLNDVMAVFDSFSRPDVMAVGAPYAYGTLDPLFGTSSAAVTWSFFDPTGANFSFVGHAEGTVDDPGAILSATPTKLNLGSIPMGQTGANNVAASSSHVTIQNASSGGASGALTVTRTVAPEIVGGDTACDGVTLAALATCLDDYRLDCRPENGATPGTKQITVTVTDPASGSTTSFPVTGTCAPAPVVVVVDAGSSDAAPE